MGVLRSPGIGLLLTKLGEELDHAPVPFNPKAALTVTIAFDSEDDLRKLRVGIAGALAMLRTFPQVGGA